MTVYDILEDKHSSECAADPALILETGESLNTFHPVLLDGLDGVLFRSVALQVSGTAGPSGVDACSWRVFCTSFGSASTDLCHAISAQNINMINYMSILLVLLPTLLAA